MTELLNIAAVVERDTVHITSKRHPDGKTYDLALMEDFGAYELNRLSSLQTKSRRLSALVDRPLTPAEKRTVAKSVKDAVGLLVLGLEPDVLAEISEVTGGRIIAAWAAKYVTDDDGAAEGEVEASPSTTAGSSRGSKRSTAATRKRGSTSRAGR